MNATNNHNVHIQLVLPSIADSHYFRQFYLCIKPRGGTCHGVDHPGIQTQGVADFLLLCHHGPLLTGVRFLSEYFISEDLGCTRIDVGWSASKTFGDGVL